jgi:D-alanyl-D-alanine carboxypeptidase/D-alanyl-D-alanine-endopeptidase (penicillin-binding protein 4)
MKFIPGIKQAKYKILCFLIISFALPYIACPENIWCTPEGKKLEEEIRAIVHKNKPEGASVGISIISISTNKPLYKLNSDKSFICASTMKLFTTAAALYYLGPNFKYKTKVYYSGKISKGKLKGDIIIKGCGDPNISGRFYEDEITAIPTSWADSIEKKGIKVITGDIIADDTIFDREFVHDNWPKDQLSEWYCAPISGLSFNDNCVDIEIKPNKKPGAPAYVRIEPKTSYVKIINECKTTSLKSKQSYSLYRKPLTNLIYVKGYIWSKTEPQKEWITVHNPPLYMATVFKEILEGKNIRIMGKARVINDSDLNTKRKLRELARTTSYLRQSIEVANQHSQGFYAEQILKTLGARIKKKGSFSAGLSVIKKFIAKKLGFSEEQYQLDDGSGLSQKNKLTPNMVTKLLRFMHKHRHGRIFFESLPVPGSDSTLEKRLKKEPYRSRIRAKTGYIFGTSALSGYIETLNEEVIAFSILVNKVKHGSIWKARLLQDNICRSLVTYN